MDVLVDALTMRDVAVGLRPRPRALDLEISSYLITSYEYVFLLEAVSDEMAGSELPPEIVEIDRLLEGALTDQDWAAFGLDIEMITDVYGTAINLVTPSANRLRHVVAVREYYHIDLRDAVNLLAAEEYDVPFLVQPGIHDRPMEHAFADRGVQILLAA